MKKGIKANKDVEPEQRVKNKAGGVDVWNR